MTKVNLFLFSNTGTHEVCMPDLNCAEGLMTKGLLHGKMLLCVRPDQTFWKEEPPPLCVCVTSQASASQFVRVRTASDRFSNW